MGEAGGFGELETEDVEDIPPPPPPLEDDPEERNVLCMAGCVIE
jgi:hypothetical protein